MESTITVNLNEGYFSISGSEEFIERNQKNLEEFITQNFKHNVKEITNNDENSIEIDEKKIAKTIENRSNDKYIMNGIYAVDQEDGTISILKRIPGKNNAEKIKNVALIVLYAKGENEKVKGSEIKTLCERQKCYDQKNFVAIFKRDMSNFIIKGKGQSWTLELSIPGKENAIQLLESMCNND